VTYTALQLDAGATSVVFPDSNNSIVIGNLNLSGTGSKLNLAGGGTANRAVANVSGTGSVTVTTNYFDSNAVLFNGQINAGAVVHSGTVGVDERVFNPTSSVGPNFQMNGGTFYLDGAGAFVLPDTSLVHTGTLVGNAGAGLDGREHMFIADGENGKVWGNTGGGLTIQASGGNPVTFYASNNASVAVGTNGGIVNEFAGVAKIAAGDNGTFGAYSTGWAFTSETPGGYGTVKLDNVQIGNGGTATFDAEDIGTQLAGTHMEANVSVLGTGTTGSIAFTNHYGRATYLIDNVTGGNTLQISGPQQSFFLNGTVAAGTTLALNITGGGSTYNSAVLTPSFALNGALQVGPGAWVDASGLTVAAGGPGYIALGAGASVSGAGITGNAASIGVADLQMNGNNTLGGTLSIVSAYGFGFAAGQSVATFPVAGPNGAQYSGGGHLLVNGTGNVVTASSSISVQYGTTVEPGAQLTIGSGATVLAATGSKLNINGNTTSGGGSVLYKNASLGSIQALLAAGTITTSTNSSGGEGVGYLTGNEYLGLNKTFFAGTVASVDVVLKHTYLGDAFLNGTVTAADYAQIDASYLLGTPNPDWFHGNFTNNTTPGYTVGAADYAAIDAGYYAYTQINGGLPLAQAQIALDTARFGAAFTAAYQADLAAGVAPVPEPASLALLGLGAVALLSRRRH
jgi:hypothetical protein